MKKILCIITLIISLFLCITPTYAVEHVDASKKVYDYAYKLSSTEVSDLQNLIKDYTKKYNMDFVLVVLNNYGGSLQSYAQDFYDYNSFGVGSKKDGIIIVLNYDAYGIDCWITTTGNAIIMYDDARINSIKQRMSSVKNQGTFAIFKNAIELASSQADSGVPASNRNYRIDKNGNYVKIRQYPFVQFFLISLAVAGIPTLIFVSKNKMVKKAVNANEYVDRQSISIYNRQDIFVSTHTTSHTISSSSGGSGGGGGSSISHGSSGISHGGGGGRL